MKRAPEQEAFDAFLEWTMIAVALFAVAVIAFVSMTIGG